MPQSTCVSGQENGKKIFPEVLRDGIESPALIDHGNLLDEWNQVSILGEYKYAQALTLGRAAAGLNIYSEEFRERR